MTWTPTGRPGGVRPRGRVTTGRRTDPTAPHQAMAARWETATPSTSITRSVIGRSMSWGKAAVGMTGASTTSYCSNNPAQAARWCWRSPLARAQLR